MGDVRSKGLMAAIAIVKDKDTREPIGMLPMESTHRVEDLMWERGVYARAMFENIAVAPPLTVTKEVLDVIVDAIDASITQMEEEML